MKSLLNVRTLGVVLGSVLFAATGAALAGNPVEDLLKKVESDFKAINDQGERERAEIRARHQREADARNGNAVVAQATEQPKEALPPIQFITPKDAKTNAAIDAALPMIKKVLAIHMCARTTQKHGLDSEGALLPLNTLAIPGVSISNNSYPHSFPNSKSFMTYHDFAKCVSIRAIDQFAMPALNALTFRVVYFAEDSGETVNFGFLFKKADDGSWRIAQTPQKMN
jgi:hypothetical protein